MQTIQHAGKKCVFAPATLFSVVIFTPRPNSIDSSIFYTQLTILINPYFRSASQPGIFFGNVRVRVYVLRHRAPFSQSYKMFNHSLVMFACSGVYVYSVTPSHTLNSAGAINFGLASQRSFFIEYNEKRAAV